MPRCRSSRPCSISSNRYLPRRRNPTTCWPTSNCGSQPKGHRKGLPITTASIRAPVIALAKLRRVTSTSGNSGIQTTGQRLNRHGLLWPDGVIPQLSYRRLGHRDCGRRPLCLGPKARRRKPPPERVLLFSGFQPRAGRRAVLRNLPGRDQCANRGPRRRLRIHAGGRAP